MTVDVRRSLINYLWTLLTTDPTLQEVMGGTVRCYLTWAEADAEFPYLVHRLDIRAEEGTFVVQRATYYLDIWSDSPDADETLAIRKRIIELLDELEFSTDEADRARFILQTDGFIPEMEQGIWHYAFMFNLRYFRVAEIDAINSR